MKKKKTELAKEDTSPQPYPQRGEGASESLEPTTGAPVGVDHSAVAGATHLVEHRAKAAGKAAKDLAEAAMQLQLEAIGGQPEFEEALLLPAEQLRKKYTAAQAEKIEWRRDGALLMLAYKVPKEQIAATMRMNLRTLDALVISQAAVFAGFTEAYAKRLIGQAGQAMELAMTKMGDASFLQLTTGAGIMVDKAIAIKGGIPSGGEEQVIDLEAEDPKLKSAREFLKLKSAKPEEEKK